MQKNRWDVERAAAWLRRHAWGDTGEAAAPPLDEAAIVAADGADLPGAGSEALPGAPEQDDIDIAGWPALVAPFYD